MTDTIKQRLRDLQQESANLTQSLSILYAQRDRLEIELAEYKSFVSHFGADIKRAQEETNHWHYQAQWWEGKYNFLADGFKKLEADNAHLTNDYRGALEHQQTLIDENRRLTQRLAQMEDASRRYRCGCLKLQQYNWIRCPEHGEPLGRREEL